MFIVLLNYLTDRINVLQEDLDRHVQEDDYRKALRLMKRELEGLFNLIRDELAK